MASGGVLLMEIQAMSDTQRDDFRESSLAAWQVAPTRDSAFRCAVWARITQARRESLGAFVKAHALGCGFALVMAMVAGGWVGHEAGKDKAQADREAMAAAYLVNIDPLLGDS